MSPPTASFFKDRIVSVLKTWFAPPAPTIGDIWAGPDASDAYRDGSLSSRSAGRPLRVGFRNLSPVPLMLCWVSENGSLRHFYRIAPSHCLSESDPLDVSDHIETSVGGHSFCWAYVPEDQMDKTRETKVLDETTSSIVGGYRPFQESDYNAVHLVTIRQEKEESILCCTPTAATAAGGLRKRKKVTDDSNLKKQQDDYDDYDDDDGINWVVRAFVPEIDPTPFDTTDKVYEKKVLGGWPVYCEPQWHRGDKKLEKRLAEDIKLAARTLPDHAREYLRTNCPIWLNDKIKYGPKAIPITGKGCCYHPDKEWLIENGLCEDKHQCIEINDGPGYKNGMDHWGRGGVIVHEMSHAFHHRCLPDGYENKEIKQCYEAAMKDGLYERVRVRGPQGPEAKAYASSNCMEYFAELSAAFLGGTDESEEFNKWFPFNRKQVKEHDPRAYEMLCRMWKIEDNEDQ